MRFGVSGGRLYAWSRRAWVLAFVAVLGVALTVAGCSADRPEPVVTASASVDVTPTPTPSAGPQRPVEMDREDLDGATAAARYFLELYPYAYNTGDLQAWRAMSDPECIFCASVVDGVEGLHAGGGYETGGELEFESVTARDPLEGNEYYGVEAVVRQGVTALHDATGRVVREMEEGVYQMLMALAFRDGAWVVREVTPEEST